MTTGLKMTQSAKEVRRILQNNYINEGFYSHVSLVIPRGKYCLSSLPLMEEFWHNYCTAIRENENLSFGIAEVPQSFIPILVDVDMKFSANAMKHGNHFYSEDLVHKIIVVYQRVIRELFIFEESDDLDYYMRCFWLEKDPYKISEDVWKNGFHIHFPNLFASKIEQETRIIPAVKKHLDDNFETYGIDSSVIDSRAVGNTWLLYGSVKADKMQPYRIAAAFSSTAEKIDLKEAVRSCVIFDGEKKKITITDDYEFFLPRILSIIPTHRKCFDIKKEEKCIRNFIFDSSKPVRRAGGRSESSVDINKVKKVVDLLSSKRAEGHDDWMTIGWAIYNITDGSERGLDIWIKFSLQTEDHDEDRCIYEWSRMVNKGTITMGTLIHLAKIDNPSGYKRFVSQNNTSRENYSEYGLSELFYEYCQEEFVYCEKTWFAFVDNFWEEDREALLVKKKMLEVLKKLLDSIHREKMNGISEDEDGKKEEGIAKDPATIARARLNTVGFMVNILEFSKLKFASKDFTRKLNSDKYLIGFKNGVYDLKNNLFRRGQPSDYISNHMNISYREFEESDSKVQETLQFFEKVIPNAGVRRYFMDIMSEVFVGYNHRKKVYFWTGEGDNGKSVTQMLFGKMLGPLCVKAPTTLITSKRGATGSANAELSRLGNGVRLVFLEEPDPSEEIYQGIFKHLSGNDEFYARDLYQSGKEVREIQPMFKIIVICNSLPKIRGGGDKATWNRVRVIPYSSTFKKDAPLLLEEQLKTSTFPIDVSLDQKIPEMVEPLAWILIKHSTQPKCEDPPEVLSATLEYQTSNDFLVSFMNIHVVEEQNSRSSKFDFYEMYKEYCRDTCSGIRPLTFMEFIKSLIKKIGSPTTEDGEGWYGYRLKSAQSGNMSASSVKENLL